MQSDRNTFQTECSVLVRVEELTTRGSPRFGSDPLQANLLLNQANWLSALDNFRWEYLLYGTIYGERETKWFGSICYEWN